MKCIQCEYFQRNPYDLMPWCEAKRRSERIIPGDEIKDLPCSKGKIKEFRYEDSNRNTERI